MAGPFIVHACEELEHDISSTASITDTGLTHPWLLETLVLLCPKFKGAENDRAEGRHFHTARGRGSAPLATQDRRHVLVLGRELRNGVKHHSQPVVEPL